MNIAELITRLQQFDPGTKIDFNVHGGHWDDCKLEMKTAYLVLEPTGCIDNLRPLRPISDEELAWMREEAGFH